MSRQSQLNRIKQAFGWKKLEEVLTGQEGVRPILMSLMGIQLENKSTVAVGQTSALTKLYPLTAIPYSLFVSRRTLNGSAGTHHRGLAPFQSEWGAFPPLNRESWTNET